MKVDILVSFHVVALDNDDLDEHTAKIAADQAAYDYLSFTKISGYSSDSNSVEVHVDGFGKCMVRLG